MTCEMTCDILLVIRSSFGDNPFRLVNLSLAPYTRILITFLAVNLKKREVKDEKEYYHLLFVSEHVLASRSMVFPVANLAVNLIIRTLYSSKVAEL